MEGPPDLSIQLPRSIQILAYSKPFRVARPTTAKVREPAKCPPGVGQQLVPHTLQCHSDSLNNKEMLPCAVVWMSLEDGVLRQCPMV